MVLKHLVFAFKATCRLWQTSFVYLQGDTRNIPEYLISKDDRISTLPDDLLYSIISLLAVRDVAKVSILARRWRYLFVSMPILNFDFRTVFGVPSVLNETDSYCWCCGCCLRYRSKFVKILNQFLKLYLGPKISYFRISFCLERKYSRWIDQCVSLAVTKGVEKLELNFVCNENVLREDNCNNSYTLSLQLLSEASNLKHLRLSACILKPDLTSQFNSLTYLYLYSVPLSRIELQMVLRNCSNLEWLTMKECTLPAQLCICDLSSLKIFALMHCKGLRNLELSATNLTTFEISDTAVIEISFSNVPKLEKVFFSLYCHNSMPYIFGEVPKVLPQLKALSIVTTVQWVQNIPASPSAFSNVKQLDFCMFQNWQYDLVKIIAPLLSALPHLQKLYVVMPIPDLFERRFVVDSPSYLHTQLKEIEIGGFFGTRNQIDFAIYLLKNVVALERMVIDAWFKMYLGGGRWRKQHLPLWSEEKRNRIRNRLLGNVLSGKTELILR